MLKITEILMDYEKEQVGMDHMPQLGWKLESDGRNIVQEAYELEIALDQDFVIVYTEAERLWRTLLHR